MTEKTSSKIIQRDPIHLWYPHELLFPEPLRVKSYWKPILIAFMLGVLLIVLLNVFYSGEDLGIRAQSMFIIDAGLPAMMGFAVWLYRYSFWRISAARRDYRLCIRCGHPISSQEADNRCPGCDHELNTEQARWGWKRAFGKPTAAVPPGSPPGTKPVGVINSAPPLATRNRFIKLYVNLGIFAVFGDELITLLLEILSVPDNLIQIWDRFSILFSVAFLIVIFVIFTKWHRRWRKRAQANDYLLCLCCGYTLEGLPEEGNCPECGVDYRSQDCQMVWERFCNRKHPLRPYTYKRKMDNDQTE